MIIDKYFSTYMVGNIKYMMGTLDLTDEGNGMNLPF
jgi:hypothetical protein